MEDSNTKWYELIELLDVLLFIFPPLALVGILMNKTIRTPLRITLIALSISISIIYSAAIIYWIGN